MLSLLLRKWAYQSKSLALGRWNTIYEGRTHEINLVNKAIEKNVYWANHDHCGGEICRTPLKTKNKNNNQNYTSKEEYFLPYTM